MVKYKLFKPARIRSDRTNLLRTAAQTIAFWTIFLWLIPRGLRYAEALLHLPTFTEQPLIGWPLFAVFSILGLSSGYTMSTVGKGTPLPFECPNRLVVRGPYRYLRNPMATAGIGQGISVGLIVGSWLIIAYALAGAVLWHWLVRPGEERDLSQRFGEDYLRYQREVRCWIPGRGYSPE